MTSKMDITGTAKPIVKKILRSPSLKRKTKSVPITQRVTLEKVLGLTLTKNAGLACDPNTGTIAYPAGCVIVLFNPRKNKQSHILNSSKKTLTTVAFSRDGKHLVSGESGHQPAVRVWDVEEKTQVAQFLGHKFGINCVVFSPNLKYIVSVGSQHDMMVNVWNWKNNSKVKSNKVSSKVNAVAFSEDGSYFVTVGNRHVKFWYLENHKSKVNETVPLLGRSGILGDQKDNFFCDVACGQGSTAGSTFCITQSGLLCEFNSKRLLDKWVELRTTSANCISVEEDHLFIGCSGGVVRVFSCQSLRFLTTLPKPHALGVDIASATSPSHMVVRNENSKYPDTIALVSDTSHKKITCVYNDHSLYIWDVRDLKKVGKAWSFLFHSSCIWGVDTYPRLTEGQTPIIPPGSFLTCSSDDTIRVWNLDPHMKENSNYKRNIYSQEVLKILYVDPTFSNLCDVNYNPAGTKDKTDTNYDGKNGVRAVKVSPDGQHLASGDRLGNVRVHDLHYMEELTTIEAHDGEVLSLEFSNFASGPRLLSSTSRDRLVHVFDVEQNYGLIQTLDDHSSAISAIKFTETDHTLKMLSCGADKSLLFRNAVLSPSFQFSLSQHLVGKTTLYDMDVDPLHKFVATACQDRNIRIYNIKTAKQKKCYKGSVGDDGVVTKVHLDPSGSYVATSSTDKNLCILDFYTGELLATMFGHSEIGTAVKFTNDLKHLISTGAEGCIFVWRLSSDFTKQMRNRLEELGRIPKDLVTSTDGDIKRGTFVMPKPIVFDQTDSNEFFPIFKDGDFKSPEKVLHELGVDEIPSRDVKPSSVAPSPQTGYRFSMGPLPSWAKPLSSDPSAVNGDTSSGGQPRGRWAQRVDTQTLSGDKPVALATDLTNEGRFSADMDSLRRETMIISQPAAPPLNMPIITADDENNIEDDADFLPLTFGPRNLDRSGDFDRSLNSPRVSDPPGLNHKWTSRRSLLVDGDDADDEETDSETREVIYYPPSEGDISESNSNCYKVFAISSDELRAGKNRLRRSVVGSEGSIKDGDSESTDPLSLEDVEEETDELSSLPTTPLEPEKDFTPTKSRFIQDNIENFTPIGKENFTNNLDNLEKQLSEEDPSRIFSPRLSISAKFLNRGLVRNVARQDTWFDSVQKRKDDMARAVDETRRKLESLGWGGEQADKSYLDKPPGHRAQLSIMPEPPQSPVRLSKTEFDSEEPSKESRSVMSDRKKIPPSYPSRSKSLGKVDTSSTLQDYRRRLGTSSIRRSWSSAELFKPIKEAIASNNSDSSLKDSAKYGKPPLPKGRNSRIPSLRGISIGVKNTATGVLPNKLRVSTFELRPKTITEGLAKSPKPTRTIKTSSQEEKLDSDSFESRKPMAETPSSPEAKSPTETADKPRLYTRRHSNDQHSYLKPTQSSRAKIARAASSTNLSRGRSSTDDLTRTSRSFSSLENLNNLDDEDLPVANFDNFRHSLSRQKTVSVPNLATCFEDEEEEEQSSNLYSLIDLSKSVPDFMDVDDTSSSYSDNSSLAASEPAAVLSLSRSGYSNRAMRDSSRKVNQWNTRRSLPGDFAGNSKPKWSRAPRSREDFDRFAMPPPSKTQVARTSFLRKAAHAKRRSAPDLTLEQAKNILLGKSGILGKPLSTSDAKPKKTLDSRVLSPDSEYPESGTVSHLKQQFSGSSRRTNSNLQTSSTNTSTPAQRSPRTIYNISERKTASGDTKTSSASLNPGAVNSLDISPIEAPVRDQPSPNSGWSSPPTKDSPTHKRPSLMNGDSRTKLNPPSVSQLPVPGVSPVGRSAQQRQLTSPLVAPGALNRDSSLRSSGAGDQSYFTPDKDNSKLKDISSGLTPSLPSGLHSQNDLSYPKQSTPVNGTANVKNTDSSKRLLPKEESAKTVSPNPATTGILRKAMMFGPTREASPTRNLESRHRTGSKEKIIDDSCSEFDEISALTVTPSKLRSRQGGLVLPWQTNGAKAPPPQSDSGVSSDTDESEPKRPARRLPTSSATQINLSRSGNQSAVSTLKPELSSKPKMSLPTVPISAHSVTQRRSSAPGSTHLQLPSQPTSSTNNGQPQNESQTTNHTSAPSRPDKSQLKLPVSPAVVNSSMNNSNTSQNKRQDVKKAEVGDCSQAIMEMRDAFRRVTHLYEESMGNSDSESQKKAEMLSSSLNDIQKSLVEMSTRNPGAASRSFLPITPTPEDEDTMIPSSSIRQQDGSMTNAISMLEPILERYSNHLTDKVFNLIQRRLDSATPSSSSDT